MLSRTNHEKSVVHHSLCSARSKGFFNTQRSRTTWTKMSRILQTKSMISWEENCECLTLQASTQRGIRQQPSQQPIKHKPPMSNQVRRPFCFSVRLTICCLQFGQLHCIGNSPGINIGATAYGGGACIFVVVLCLWWKWEKKSEEDFLAQ